MKKQKKGSPQGKPMLGIKKSKTATVAMAGVAGAVVGAGVAVAATRVLSDKKMRDKVKSTLTGVKDQVYEAIDKTAMNGKNGTKLGKKKTSQKKIGKSKSSARSMEMPQMQMRGH